MERMLIHSRVRCPRCYQAQQGNKPARMLSLVRPAGVGLRAHQRLLAEDTGSLGPSLQVGVCWADRSWERLVPGNGEGGQRPVTAASPWSMEWSGHAEPGSAVRPH